MKKSVTELIAMALVIMVGFIFLKIWMDLRWTSLQFYGIMSLIWIGYGAFLLRGRISKKVKE
jgi:hypothetical protein